ncbi:hypothetical protein C8Q79DRAFT_948629 [Trametes meyenii]|nr:hypothetical protein C8Q79DRAFT_948629 [Trametes meyenii]
MPSRLNVIGALCTVLLNMYASDVPQSCTYVHLWPVRVSVRQCDQTQDQNQSQKDRGKPNTEPRKGGIYDRPCTGWPRGYGAEYHKSCRDIPSKRSRAGARHTL